MSTHELNGTTPYRKKRIPHSGKIYYGMVEQEREFDPQKEDKIFGLVLVQQQELVHQTGKYWEECVAREGVSTARSQSAFYATQYPETLRRSRKQLLRVFDTDRTACINLFRSFYEAQPDIFASVKRSTGMDYTTDDDFPATVEQRMNDVRDQHDLSEDQLKSLVTRQAVIDEVLEIMCSRIDSGEGEEVIEEEHVISVLRHHVAEQKKRLAVLHEKLPAIVQAVQTKIQEHSAQGILPIDTAVLNARIEGLHFSCIDPLQGKLEELWGFYSFERHEVGISSDVPDDQLPSVVAHELFHAADGRSLSKAMDDYTDDGLFFDVSDRKRGLLFRRHSERGRGPQLTWLNEAVTEMATLDLHNLSARDAYHHERLLVQELLGHGLQKDILYRAYFENDSVDITKHRLPATKELFRVTNELFYNGFLIDLDVVIRDIQSRTGEETAYSPITGVRSVFDQWKSQPDDFLRWLRTEAKRARFDFKHNRSE